MNVNVGRWLAACLAPVLAAVLFAGCSAELHVADAVQASAEATADTGSALSSGSILWIDGTYGAGCTGRASGHWSVRVSGMATMDYAALTVVQNNTPCVLTLTKIIADQTYVAASGIAMTGSYQGTATSFTPSGGGGISLYANAYLSTTTFASSFVVQVLYSDNPNLNTNPLAGVRVDQHHVEHDERPVAQLHARPRDGGFRRDRERPDVVGLVGLWHRATRLRIHRRRRLLRRPRHAPVRTQHSPSSTRPTAARSTTSISGTSTVTIAASAFRTDRRQHLLLRHAHHRRPTQQLGHSLLRNVHLHLRLRRRMRRLSRWRELEGRLDQQPRCERVLRLGGYDAQLQWRLRQHAGGLQQLRHLRKRVFGSDARLQRQRDLHCRMPDRLVALQRPLREPEQRQRELREAVETHAPRALVSTAFPELATSPAAAPRTG